MKLIMLFVIALSLAATGCITYNEASDVTEPEAVYVTQTPEPTPVAMATAAPDNNIVIVMDTSGSMRDSEIISESGVSYLDYEKELIITILDDKEFRDDYIGAVGFGGEAYVISPLVYFGHDPARESLKDTIRMIVPTGDPSTSLEDGLSMAEEMLTYRRTGAKDVIILSDGNKIDYGSSLNVATRMKDKNVRLHFIHVMSSPTSVLSTYEKLADTLDAIYYQTSYPKSININEPTLTSTKVIQTIFPTQKPEGIEDGSVYATATPTPLTGCAALDQSILRMYDQDQDGLVDDDWAINAAIDYEQRRITQSGYDQIKYAYEHQCPIQIYDPAPTPVPTAINSCYRLDACIWAPLWDLDTIALMYAASDKGRGHNITPAIEYVTIRVDGTLVATIAPAFVHPHPRSDPNRTRRLIECPMLINLPDGILNTGEITMEVSISDTPNLADGIYPMPISVLTPPPRYEDEYSTYPVYNP